MLKFTTALALCLISVSQLFATDPYPRNPNIDIQHYLFQIDLNDSDNTIAGTTEVTILFKNSVSSFELDLVGKSQNGGGMIVSSVTQNKNPLKFTQQNDRLSITLNSPPQKGEELTITINYSGTPSDGLVISTNKFGDRTFFGDNWPNRAHHWLPTIDHPYDKASCEFIITAPSHYQAIANGILVEKTNLPNNRTLTHWKETVVLPTKVMVIGVAKFAVSTAGVVNNIPVETWVYPQNKEAGFGDFKMATSVLNYFIEHVGPYPYQKLANVQSTTRFGGMENASNIFYFENSVTGKNEREGLIAHEIAHQWFGDSASEMDWYHVWLSEGFATYFTNLYYEATYGKEELASRMATQRTKVVAYYKENPAPVIDTTLIDINKVLSTNSYQKGSWVLHMLRKEVGDKAFWNGIRTYYQTYQNSNALTSDFRAVMEKASGKDLKQFFDQWLRIAGHPEIAASWSYDAKKKQVDLIVKQVQTTKFTTPIEIGVKTDDGSMGIQTLQLAGKETKFSFSAEKRPLELILDPQTWLLFEGKINGK
ncbi:MAG: M1 family metallopeptidase [Cyclobacteriaceae bacterium]